MKKLVLALSIVAVIMSFGIVAGAETIGNNDLGMYFEIPEGFHKNSVNDNGMKGFYNFLTQDNRACINLSYMKEPKGYFEGGITDEEFNRYLDLECATEYLSRIMSGRVVNFKSKNVYDKVIEGTKYYFFDGEYSLTIKDDISEDFSVTAITWAKNGRLYVLSYIYFVNAQSFDVEAFLGKADFSSAEIKIYVNDNRVYSDTPPAAMEGRTLVPIRAVAEAMGYTVEWDGDNNLVTLIPENIEDNRVVFEIDSSEYFINDEVYNLDVPAIAISGRTYIPLRAAAEAMGAVVTWDASSNSAMLVH